MPNIPLHHALESRAGSRIVNDLDWHLNASARLRLTSPLVFSPFEREFSGLEKPSGKELEMKKSWYTDEQIAVALKQVENRHAGSRSHPADGDFRANVLSVEEGVWRSHAPVELVRLALPEQQRDERRHAGAGVLAPRLGQRVA
jgi:hypothetical protein